MKIDRSVKCKSMAHLAGKMREVANYFYIPEKDLKISLADGQYSISVMRMHASPS